MQNERRLGDTAPRELPPMLERPAPDFARAGFGRGTVSVPGAAYRTIKRGMDGARETVPTAEELRSELRSRLAREREAREVEANRQREAARLEQTGERINMSIRGGGSRGGASVQVNGEVSKYPAAGNSEAGPMLNPSFDVTA